MPKKPIARGSTLRKVQLNSKPLRKVSHEAVAKAVGAEIVHVAERPLELLEISHTLRALLRSSGGRPKLASAEERVKIPKIEEDWAQLESLVEELPAGNPFKPSPAQLAAVVLHLGLTRISRKDLREAVLTAR